MRQRLFSRQTLVVVGILVALVGIRFDNRWVVWSAIAVLGVSVLHRAVAFLHARRN